MDHSPEFTSVKNQVNCYSMVPDEIFIHVFEYLPLEDRKNIRLTCRWFYELCDVSSIQSSEVIALNGDWNSASALLCLSKSSRKIQNIKFRQAHIRTEAVTPFFEQQGANVQSVVFESCFFDPGTLKCVIEKCVNLRNFSLEFSHFSHCCGYYNILDDFEFLETNSVIRESVTSVSLVFLLMTSYLSNRKFKRFFIIFPRITKLIFIIRKTLDLKNWNASSANLTSDTSFTLSCIYDRLSALADQLEVLKFGVDSSPSRPFESLEPINNILKIRMKNLKELSLKWSGFHADISTMVDFSQFQQLTCFNCSFNCFYCTPIQSVATLMQQLLTNSPLRRLKITGSNIPMNLEFFHLLVTCELEVLQVDQFYGDTAPFLFLMNSDPSASANALVPNYRLQYLFIRTINRFWNLLFAFYFRSVKYLQLSHVHPDILENILKRRLKIHGLCLESDVDQGYLEDASYSQPWLREEIIVNSEFQYLVELKIKKVYWLTSFLLGRFQFPTLKMLHVDFESLSEDNEKEFWQLIRNLPKLECLKVKIPRSKVNFTRELVGLSKLRHCDITNISGVEDVSFSICESDFIQMFDDILSLRSIVYRRGKKLEFNYFFKDVTTNTVVNAMKGEHREKYAFSYLLKSSVLNLDVINDETPSFFFDYRKYPRSFFLDRRVYIPLLHEAYPSHHSIFNQIVMALPSLIIFNNLF